MASERRLHPLCDRGCNHILHGEYVLDFSVVTLGPQVVPVGNVGELRGNADALSDTTHRALQHGAYAELIPDGTQIHILSLERKRRRSAGDAKFSNVREGVED